MYKFLKSLPADKVMHFGMTGHLTLAFMYTIIALSWYTPLQWDILVASGVSFVSANVIGLLKEYMDKKTGNGNAEKGDILANLLGSAHALIPFVMLHFLFLVK